MEALLKAAGVGLGIAGGITSAVALGLAGAPAIAIAAGALLVPAATYTGGWLVLSAFNQMSKNMEGAAIVLILPAMVCSPIAAVGAGAGTHFAIDYVRKNPESIRRQFEDNLPKLAFNTQGGMIVRSTDTSTILRIGG